MILGTTAKEQVRSMRIPRRVFVIRAKLIDTRTAWFCFVWTWYDAYLGPEGEAILGKKLYGKDLPPSRKRRPAIPTLRKPAYELFSQTEQP